MPDEASGSQPDISITIKGPSELKLSITISPTKTVLELKEIIAEKSDVEKERQRLIYSGKVLKDEDPISNYKIQTGHTLHMVKGANKAAQQASASSATPPRLPQMGTGLNVSGNPVDNVENIHHGLAGFNPFAGMEGMNNLNDPNAMAGMMNSPEFMRSMSEMMSRPEVVEQIIASNPQLASMGPQIRQMMNNPMVRQMMSNPETLRMMMQMQSSMGGAGGGGGMGGMAGMFGAPGGAGGSGAQPLSPPTDPFPNLFAPNAGAGAGAGAGNTTGGAAGPGGAGANPFASLFGPGGPSGFGGAGAGGAGAGAGANPFGGGFNPAMLFGPGGAGGAGGFGGFGGAGGLGGLGGIGGAPAAPVDSRPPEEIYATQLGQLNAMGLWDAQKNIRALRSTGGNVEAAVDMIFSGQLD